MAKCSSCSAPLPATTIFCAYCGTRNDIDLGEKKFKNIRPHLSRQCPTCKIALQTIDVGEKISFFVERCPECYGLFFDRGELEDLVEMSVKSTQNVNVMQLAELSENPRHIDVVTYRQCPVCEKMMQRVNFMKRSGVVTDYCADHGIWLDSGELRHILEWIKSGGMSKIESTEKDFESTHNYPKGAFQNAKELKKRNKYRDPSSDAEESYESLNIMEILGNILFRTYR